MTDRLYTASFIADHISELRGLTGLLRTVRYWASSGLLRASGKVITGKGKHRLFPDQEIVRAGILLELATWGVPVGLLEGAMTALSKACTNLGLDDDLIQLIELAPKGFIVFTGVLRRDGECEIRAAVSLSSKFLSLSAANVVISINSLRNVLP
jgi:DNA-binding transcriptional MerR regulator